MTGASENDDAHGAAAPAADGVAKVQAQSPRALPRRFYKTVSIVPANDQPAAAFHVLLDGRITKTPATKRPLVVPSKPLAEAIAEEWDGQHDVINPETMGLTRLANTAVDGVAGAKLEVVAGLVAYAASDALCYRAETPQALAAQQSAVWEPLLRLIEAETGAIFITAAGIMPVEQPRSSLDLIDQAFRAENEFRLTALHVMTTLTGSALLALLVRRGVLRSGDAWAAANIEEDWQIAQWGEDFEAAERRARRWRDMQSAAHFLDLLADAP